MPEWLVGPPTEPGLYWYVVQGSGVAHYTEVWRDFGGPLVCAGSEGVMSVEKPFRRWMPATPKRPEVDMTWTDPRYQEARDA